MEEINLKELFEYLKSQILLIMIFVLIPILACCFYKAFLEKPVYESTTSIILAGFKTEDDNTIDNNELTINQKLVTTYQAIAKSKEVLNEVISELNIDYKYSDLQERVSVSNVTDTEIIKVTVRDDDPDSSCMIAKKLADVFIKKVREIYNISNASVLDEAEVPDTPSNMSIAKSMVICAALGVMMGIAFVVILFYFDTSIKTAEQIESKFNVVVLGQIPDYNSKKKKKGDKK